MDLGTLGLQGLAHPNFGTFGLGFMDSTTDPSKGAGFQAQGVNPANQLLTTNSGQLDSAYAGSNYGIDQQRSFLQNLGGFDSVGNANSLYGQQQGLANQLQMQAAGGGPNPAMDQLALTTGQNVQNQAALMAGQRGARGNPGLMARQIASQGAQTQQGAAGQAAVMRANQQLAAQQALMQQQGAMGNTNANMMNARQGALNGYNQSAQNMQNMLLGAATANNAQNIGMQSNINNANAGIAQQNASTQGSMTQGFFKGVGKSLPIIGQNFADGGVIGQQPMPQPPPPPQDTSINAQNISKSFNAALGFGGPKKYAGGGSILANFAAPQMQMAQQVSPTAGVMNVDLYSPHLSQATPWDSKDDKKSPLQQAQQGPVAPSGGDTFSAGATPFEALPAELGPASGTAMLASNGGRIPGRAQFGGDDERNDTVDARLSPGEVVIPRTKVHDEVKIATFLNDLLGTSLRPGEKFSQGGQANPKLQQSRYSQGGPVYAADGMIMPQEQPQMTPNQYMTPDPRMAQQPQAPMAAPVNPNAPMNVPPPPPTRNQGNGGQNPFAGMPEYAPKFERAERGVIGGMEQEAGAQIKAAKDVDQYLNSDEYKKGQGLIQDHAKALNDIQGRMNHAANAINGIDENGKPMPPLDYNRVWHNMGIPGKIMSVLGMVIGGMGAGRDGENPAVQVLNDLTERDIRQQQDDLGKKKTALDGFVKQYGSVEDGMKALRLEMNAMTAAKIQQIGAKYASPEIQGRLQQLSNSLIQKDIPQLQSLSTSETLRKNAGAGGDYLSGLRVLNPEMAKEVESRYIPGIGMAQVPISEQNRSHITARLDLDNKLKALQEFATENAGSVDPSVRNRGAALAADVQDAVRSAKGLGVFREGEQGFVEKMISSDPTKFFAEYRTLPGYGAIREGNRATLQNMFKSLGVNYKMSDEKKPKVAPGFHSAGK